MAALKLYLPYGALQRVADSRLVTFHWFCRSRETPLAPYVSLIMGYKNLTESTRLRAEAMVDEFLSETEFGQLRAYLRSRHGEDLRTTLLVAPVSAIKPDAGTHIGQERPFTQCIVSPGAGNGFYKLSEEEGYTLPFEVWGYYSLPSPARSHAPVLAAQALTVEAPLEPAAEG